MVDRCLPTISSLVALGEFVPEVRKGGPDDAARFQPVRLPDRQAQRAEAEWQGAIAALQPLLAQPLPAAGAVQGVLLSGPFPVLDVPALTAQLSNWAFIPRSLEPLSLSCSQLMPADQPPLPQADAAAHLVPLLDGDPLIAERFCVLLTPSLSLVLVLGKDANDELHFQFSFTPGVIAQVWQLLRSRLVLTQPRQLTHLEALVKQFSPVAPDYRLVSQFSRLMLSALPDRKRQSRSVSPVERVWNPDARPPVAPACVAQRVSAESRLDTELLKAMAHEIRTPLTTIRTLTRSLLRRQELAPNILKRLKQIDCECTQQIDRFNLIFKAVELESVAHKSPRSPLTATSLTELFQDSIPQWQQAANRRNLSLEVKLPTKLPMVVSDPSLLQLVLTGLVELFTHSVPSASHIQLQVMSAGHQLKLQFQSQPDQTAAVAAQPAACSTPPLKSLGHLLLFQPETGGVSLNLNATKTLFQALGAKLIVRERPAQGATWTVFLPLETANLEQYPIV